MLNLRTMYRLRRLINVMLPVLATQLAIIGMNFFDATMSGHAGAEQLAGSSIGGIGRVERASGVRSWRAAR